MEIDYEEAQKIVLPEDMLRIFLGKRDYELYRDSNGGHFGGDVANLKMALLWLQKNPQFLEYQFNFRAVDSPMGEDSAFE
jgi:hypothetical protein